MLQGPRGRYSIEIEKTSPSPHGASILVWEINNIQRKNNKIIEISDTDKVPWTQKDSKIIVVCGDGTPVDWLIKEELPEEIIHVWAVSNERDSPVDMRSRHVKDLNMWRR